jgi:hypothetical protein
LVTPAARRGSGALTATGTQRPGEVGRPQFMHLPVQAESQQTPSAQKPDLHWLVAVHGWPRPRRPQLPPVHMFGTAQSALPAQTTLQAPSAQIDGEQLMGEPARHVPLPSQLEAGVSPPPEQAGGLHITPAA